MRRVKIIIIVPVFVAAFWTAGAQNAELILKFMGVDEAEEVSSYDVERLEDFLGRPLRINQISVSAMEESGLFTRYQAVSLEDYRSRHGDVLSYTELAAVDGFGIEYVSRLAPFISLESGRLPGHTAESSVRNDLSVRAGLKNGNSLAYGLKYRLEVGERLSGGMSVSRTASATGPAPDAFSGYLALHFRRLGGKLLIGSFNARFGQGLSLWSGMSFSGLTSASSFMRRSSGISASSSFTGSYAMKGVALDLRFRRLGISCLSSCRRDKGGFHITPAVNISRYFRIGQVSLTHYACFSADGHVMRIPDMKTAADMALCVNGTDLFAEIAYDWVSSTVAGLAGISSRAGDDVRISAMLRYYPSSYSSTLSAAARSTTVCSNEYAASAASDVYAGKWIEVNGAEGFGSNVRRHSGRFSLDGAYFPVHKSSDSRRSIQIKGQAEWSMMLSGAFRLTFRLSERLRTWGEQYRTDLRSDLSYISRRIIVNVRVNAMHSIGTGLLGYVEGGYRTGRLALHVRQGIFRIDNWADRIYAYERDAPGSFNVPAYYGRGIWSALTLNWKFARWGRLYMRAAMTSYPFMTQKKPGRAELKFQFTFSF